MPLNVGGANLPDMSPHSVLQVFRILQEALTNALKHSTGDTIAIDVYPHQITLSDNGTKLDEPRRGGHGRGNMKARAHAIGATLEIGRREGSTVVAVSFAKKAEDSQV
ncbi:MAG: ATP-binding protein [Pontixanthobacter sp.]